MAYYVVTEDGSYMESVRGIMCWIDCWDKLRGVDDFEMSESEMINDCLMTTVL